MKRALVIAALCFVSSVLQAQPFQPSTIALTGTIRDFQLTHPDMQYRIGFDLGIVEPILGPDGKPVYTTTQPFTFTTHGRELFDQWYRDVAGVNLRTDFTLPLTNSTASPNVYTYDNQNFFPINGQLYGNQGMANNYYFTFELHSRFTYQGGEVFNFRGDDDVWVFINKRRVIDLGGVHGAADAQVNLNAVAAQIGLQVGKTYDFDLFFAERFCCGSSFRIQTSIVLEQPPEEEQGHAVVHYTGDRAGDYHDPATLSAELLDDSKNPPVAIPDAVLTFRLGGQSCKAPTDAQGRASCSLTPDVAAGDQPLHVEFPGDFLHAPAAASDTFSVRREQALLTAVSARAGIGGAVRAVLREDGAVPVAGWPVTFRAGALSAAAMTGADGAASATLALSPGDHSVEAVFDGDGFYAASTATWSVRVLPPQIAVLPQTNVAAVGSAQTVAAQILDLGAARLGERIGFDVIAGPNTGTAGTCEPAGCAADASGRVTFRYTGGPGPGSDTVRAYLDANRNGAFDAGEAQATTILHWTSRHATEIHDDGASSGDYHDAARLSAVLVDTEAEPDAPVAGALLAFSSPAGSCAARTDAAGRAFCWITPQVEAGSYELLVDFAGDSRHRPARAAGTFAVTREQTTLAITSPAVLATGQVVVRAVLREDGSLPIPGRDVVFQAGSVSVHAVTDAAGMATADLGLLGGEHQLSATFAADAFYQQATATLTRLLVYAPGQFVIWGSNAPELEDALSLGQTCMFWGAQWADQVRAGDYEANASFKGYADDVFSASREWQTRPGDSSHPPQTVPAYLGVLISTSIRKSDSIVHGNFVGIGVLRVTNPAAYQPDPGHPASGVLLAVLPPDGAAGGVAGTPPAAPTGVTATAGEGFAEVRWTPPGDIGSGPITGYTVFIAPGDLRVAVPAGETSRIVTGLALNASYTFTVAATNVAGTGPASELSQAVISPTVPGAPRAVAALAGDGSAIVTWGPPESDGGSPVLFYRVEPLPAGAAVTVPGGTFSASIPGLENGTAYTFVVRAQNAAGAGPESAPSAPVLPMTIPSAPLAVVADAGDHQATVYWTAAAGGGSSLASYRVTALPGGASITVPGDRVFAILSGLDNGVAYRFSVIAAGGTGESPASAPSGEVVPFGLPAAPSAVQGTRGNGTALVTWSAPASDGGRAITGYTVIASPGDLASAVPAGGTSRLITGLANGTAYTFRVEAVNQAGPGAPSTASTAVTPATVPGEPTAVQAVAGGGQATVSWTAPAADGGSPITVYSVVSHPGLQQVSVSAGVTTATVGGLTNGTEYVFTVRAANALGRGPESQPSSPVTPAVLPGAPTNVLASLSGVAAASVSWTAPAANGGAPITGYTVTSSPGGLTVSVAGTAASTTVSGLTLGTTYTFTVTATNRVGTGPASAPSNAVTAATTPGAPTAVTAVDGNASATVTWTPPAATGFSPISSYTVTSSPGGFTTTVNGATTSAVLSGLANGTQYTFTVRATNAVGSGPFSAPSNPVTPATVPGAPTAVTAAVAGDASVRVTWTPPASNGGAPITGYTVTSTPGGLTASADGATTAATVPGLIVGTTYTFRVTATNRKGTGAASAPSNAVTAAGAPGAPTNVTAVDGNASATVTWTPPASNGSSPITGYEVVSSPGGISVSVGAGVTTATVPGLQNGTAYTFSVRAVNAIGAGPFSAPSNPVTPATVPGAPTGVTAALGGNAAATVSWTPPATDGGAPITSYLVTSSPGGLTVSASGTTTARVPGLTVGTTYTFTVAAVNRKGTGPASAASNPLTAAAVPDAPTGVSATPGDGSAVVTWIPPADGGPTPIVTYTVTYPGGTLTTVPGTATSATITGLTNGTAYTFTVRATNAAGTGPESAPSAPVTPHAAGTVVLASLTLSPSEVTGGAPASGTVSLTGPAPAGGVVVALASNSPAAGVPASVTVPGGATSASFPVTTQAVSAITDVAISATLDGTTRTAVLRLRPVPPGTPPTAEIQTPADGAEVTTLTQIVGTAVASDLRDWILEVAPAGETAFTRIAAGTGPVISGVLGTFDPTLLLNDLYTVRLRVFTTTGASAEASVAYAVDGNQKIGNFTLSFTDLNVPVSGLPITVIRNYDSRDKKVGDFGVGWTLELRQGSYRNNRTPGQGWEIQSSFLPCQSVKEVASHTTVVRLSDQEVYRFRLNLGSPAPTIGGCFAEARFDFVDGPVPGASLSILGDTEVFWENGTDYVVDLDTFDLFEPRQVRLTTRDGRSFDLELRKGVTRLQDLNGNNLVIGSSGVTHSSGKSISFARDGAGRITSITDPMGKNLTYTYDAAGDLVAVADRENQITRFTYDGNHRVLAIEDPRGITPLRNEYDADGRLIRHIDAFGKEVEYIHNLAANQEIVTDRLGHSRLLEYDDRGNVVHEVDALSNETLRTFDVRDHMLTETNAQGETKTYTYDANGNRASETDAEGNTTSYTYDSRGYARTITDARGKVTRHEYDTVANLLSITDPLGNATTFTYDARGEVLKQTDSEGNAIIYEHDSTGNLTREIDPLGHATTYTYDANGNRLTRTTTRTISTGIGTETLRWSYSYDDVGRLISTTDPDGSTASSAYEAAGNLTERVDKLGRHTTFTYNEMGRLVATIYPDGTTETTDYDAEGRRTSATDRAGRTTRYEYDALGRLIATTYPDGSVESSTYDDTGRLESTTDARGNTTSYQYDHAGRHTRTVDALGHVTSFEYDGNYRLTTVTDAKGRITRYRYDDAGRQTEVAYPDGTSQVSAFDRMGRRVAETDQVGRTNTFGYDALGRLITVTDALDQVTAYGYDEVGNRVRQTDANDHTTLFEYDSLGRQVRRTLPMGASETMEHDAAGNMIRRVDFNGATTTFTYDLNDHLTSRSYPDGTSVGFTYTLSGRRATALDGGGTTAYQYDSRDRLVRLADPFGRILEYGWDGQGNRTSVTTRIASQILTTGYIYDALNRRATVSDPLGRSYALSFDEVGNRVAVVYPNGVQTTYEYDALDRLMELVTRTSTGGVLQSYAYTLDSSGHRTRIDEHGGTVRSYEYDGLYRLTRETVSGAASYENTFTYDPVGNRLAQVKSNGSGTQTINSAYDERDRLLTAAGTTYTWDENGQLRTRSGVDGATYVWNFDGRLTQVLQADGAVITHAYDADGNRVRTEITPATGPPAVIEYLVDTTGDLSQVVAETDSAGRLTAYYVRGDDLLAALRPGGTRFFHADGLGSIRALTDETGTVTDTYTFSAFGELLGHTGTDPQPYAFAGEPYDPNTGFQYHRARWMDPQSGRFSSMDPLAPRVGPQFGPPGLQRYWYADADPVDQIDASGLDATLAEVNASLEVSSTLRVQSVTTARGAQVAINKSAGKALEKFVENLVRREFPNASIKVQRALTGPGGKRVYDLLVKVGDRIVIIETKTRIPAGGSAFRRLIGQILTFSNAAEAEAAGAEVIVFSEGATEAALARVAEEIGVEASPHFIQGAVELISLLRVLLLGG
jgi:fibro-slime domain-containing protein/RHS repeat-associated protein